jgi:methionine--tRNA ligase beta chain
MTDTISFTDFKKLDIRIGTIKKAEKLENTEKLARLTVDLGREKKQIIAGIAKFYKNIKSLEGKQIPILTNIKKQTFKGYESQGMIIAADEKGKPIMLHPEKKLKPGSIVR